MAGSDRLRPCISGGDVVAGRPARSGTSRWTCRAAAALAASCLLLSACGDGPRSPVFGAVFGLENAETIPFRSGQVPEPAPQPGDRVLGLAANAPGQCIFLRANGRHRFIASCPEGYDV